MGFIKKTSNEKQLKKFEINLNKTALTKENFRQIQLAAYFHYLKLELGGEVFSEIEAENNRYYIPFSFTINETVEIVMMHGMKMLYLELDENQYVEIRFDTITISGTDDLYNECKTLLKYAEQYVIPPDLFYLDLSKNADWLWNKYLTTQFESCMMIGNKLIKNGCFIIYPLEDDETEIVNAEDFNKYKNQIEYIAIRSFLDENKTIVIDNVTKEIFATNLDELEKVELSEFFHLD